MLTTASRSATISPFPGIQRVSSFKLLGVFVSEDLKWAEHVNFVTSKANSRLHFLKQLKRTGISKDDMLHFYVGFIRPVLEYAAPVWHTSLTNEQSDHLESIQKRAFRIIHGYSRITDASYENFCAELSITPLCVRREELSKTFFDKLFDPGCCIHHLLPEKRDMSQSQKLRKATQYQAPFARTERFKNSFLLYALNNYL